MSSGPKKRGKSETFDQMTPIEKLLSRTQKIQKNQSNSLAGSSHPHSIIQTAQSTAAGSRVGGKEKMLLGERTVFMSAKGP